MKSKLVLLAILSTLSLSVFAGNDNANPCGNNGNNCNAGGNGGSWGDGGSSTSTSQATGVGIGVGIGIGGNATGGSVDSDIRNTNTNVNSNSNGQLQGQSTSNSNNARTSLTVGGDKFEAAKIPVGGSIAASANGTAECLVHKQVSFNAFFVSFANGGHEVEYICMAEKLGLHTVAVQMSCNKDSSFKKAYNQVAELNGTAACLE
jgi:hypothetical protein